jgi:spore coat protein U-like protein
MRALIAALVAACAVGAVHAQSGVACTAGTTSGLFSFGNVVAMAPAGVSTLLGEFVVRCSNVDNVARNVRLRLAISAGSSGTTSQRQMRQASAATPLLYNLFEDAGYTVVWTATTGGRPDEFLNLPARTTAEIRRPIFGRVPGRQTAVTPGLYSDTLIATVRY